MSTDNPTELSTTVRRSNPDAPAHVQQETTTGLEDVSKYIRPSRLKVIQSGKDEIYKDFNEGDVIVTPTLLRVCAKEGEFEFTPIFTFTEFVIENPFLLRATLPMFRERTFDPNSEIAKRAINFESFICPEDPKEKEECRYLQYVNFIVCIHGIPQLQFLPVLISFSKGSASAGNTAWGIMQARGSAIYGCRFRAIEGTFKKAPYPDWRGVRIKNPADDSQSGSWVSNPDEFDIYKQLHQGFVANAQDIEADYGDIEVVMDGTVGEDTLG